MSSGEITVYFRIVGIYFGSVPGSPPNKNATGDVMVRVGSNPTVKDVLDAVEQKANGGSVNGVTGFRYSTSTMSGKEFLQRVEVDYNTQPKPSRSYPAGTYVLANEPHNDPQRILQYYIYSEKEVQSGANEIVQKNTNNTFNGINENLATNPGNNEIEDGDFLVWRLVTIRTQPEIQIPEIPTDPIPDPIPVGGPTGGTFPLARGMMGDERNFTSGDGGGDGSGGDGGGG